MTLHTRDHYTIPPETARVARAAFPKGNVYMTMRDKLDLWYKDSSFASLFESHQGRPAESPGRLALITVMQFAEGLTDRQAAEAVRSRIDWKYALALPLTDAGFDFSVLSNFRGRLLAGDAEQKLLDDMLCQFQEQGLLKARGQQRTDSTRVLAAIRELNRMELVGETLRHALNDLATMAPEWLRARVSADWFELYGTRFEMYRLPKEKKEFLALADRIGADGAYLLAMVYDETAPAWLRQIPAVQTLRLVWIQQYQVDERGWHWRGKGNTPPAAQMIQSPYDVEAHYCRIHSKEWIGYKVHLTETCDEERPNLITHVHTTEATTADETVLDDIHQSLADKGLLPGEHLVDTGYTNLDDLLKGRNEYHLELIGPFQMPNDWQSRAGEGFGVACFVVDWEHQVVTCPMGKTSTSWSPGQDIRGRDRIQIRFSPADCTTCTQRAQCTKTKSTPRSLSIKPREQYIALRDARAYQQTEEFKEKYRKRAGVEGSVSQGVRAFGLRRTRYIGLAKTHLQEVAAAAAMNLTRAVAWLYGTPRAQTRTSAFAALAPAT
jgi:transposase